MGIEIKATHSDHYVLCSHRFADKTIETIKADVRRFMCNRKKDDSYSKFIDWQKKDNELLVLTTYAHDDINLPKKFDVIFQVDKPNNFIDSDFTITQAVMNGWTPLNHISKGHKHICIIEFDKEVPDIFDSVPVFNNKRDLQKSIQLGFCGRTDFESITTGMKRT